MGKSEGADRTPLETYPLKGRQLVNCQLCPELRKGQQFGPNTGRYRVYLMGYLYAIVCPKCLKTHEDIWKEQRSGRYTVPRADPGEAQVGSAFSQDKTTQKPTAEGDGLRTPVRSLRKEPVRPPVREDGAGSEQLRPASHPGISKRARVPRRAGAGVRRQPVQANEDESGPVEAVA